MVPAARAVLDMAAFAHNFAWIRAAVPDSRIMAVIKANAYGHGLVRAARALPAADAFAVARVEEGVVLRQAGIAQRIAVLQGYTDEEGMRLSARHGLEPVIHSGFQLDLLERLDTRVPMGVWLKADSGMHRLGLGEEEFARARTRLARMPQVCQPVPVMTHLANADVTDDPATEIQLRCFGRMAGDGGEFSIANSAGLMAWEAARGAWVRPGILLYGVSPFPGRPGPEEGLRPVMTLQSRLIAIKHLKTGDAVGYGGDFVCRRPTRMGIAAIGYGDGYPRRAATGTPVLVRGRRVPLIGRVSMDMISVDLTDCPTAEIGDTVTLWGQGLPVEEVARCADTIPYVLLCNVTQRVNMVETAA
ncbi:alanine racemase [Methylococcus geothermalis]|uniref:Alanine racemase n=1 Tax=Methylococcus geothermalis TaxID=2681310 RepID=A0A858Q9F3_9GAMM|nr:alanine racemase [Methylococcus geothermalis]QJD30354.1 alanine racemase [Methylococcus geothermalis]